VRLAWFELRAGHRAEAVHALREAIALDATCVVAIAALAAIGVDDALQGASALVNADDADALARGAEALAPGHPALLALRSLLHDTLAASAGQQQQQQQQQQQHAQRGARLRDAAERAASVWRAAFNTRLDALIAKVSIGSENDATAESRAWLHGDERDLLSLDVCGVGVGRPLVLPPRALDTSPYALVARLALTLHLPRLAVRCVELDEASAPEPSPSRSVERLTLRAQGAAEVGDMKQCEVLLRRAIDEARAPDEASVAWAELGAVLERTGRAAEARAAYDTYLSWEPAIVDVGVIARVARLHEARTDGSAGARAALEAYLSLARESPSASAWLGCGVALTKLGRFAEAERALTEANRLDRRRASTWLALAKLALTRFSLQEREPRFASESQAMDALATALVSALDCSSTLTAADVGALRELAEECARRGRSKLASQALAAVRMSSQRASRV
jgi:tetratricopeptide (TPR) repeat protein